MCNYYFRCWGGIKKLEDVCIIVSIEGVSYWYPAKYWLLTSQWISMKTSTSACISSLWGWSSSNDNVCHEFRPLEQWFTSWLWHLCWVDCQSSKWCNPFGRSHYSPEEKLEKLITYYSNTLDLYQNIFCLKGKSVGVLMQPWWAMSCLFPVLGGEWWWTAAAAAITVWDDGWCSSDAYIISYGLILSCSRCTKRPPPLKHTDLTVPYGVPLKKHLFGLAAHAQQLLQVPPPLLPKIQKLKLHQSWWLLGAH